MAKMFVKSGMGMKKLLFGFVTAAVASASQAVVFNYTDAISWQTAVDTYQSISFTSLADGTALTNQYAGAGVNFNGTTFITAIAPPIFEDGKGIWQQNQFGPIEISFTGLRTAFATDFPGAAQYDLYNGATLVGSSNAFGSAGTGFFGGVVSTVAFNRVLVKDWADDLVFVDNIHYGNAAVPEPASMIALGLGVSALVARKRRK